MLAIWLETPIFVDWRRSSTLWVPYVSCDSAMCCARCEKACLAACSLCWVMWFWFMTLLSAAFRKENKQQQGIQCLYEGHTVAAAEASGPHTSLSVSWLQAFTVSKYSSSPESSFAWVMTDFHSWNTLLLMHLFTENCIFCILINSGHIWLNLDLQAVKLKFL